MKYRVCPHCGAHLDHGEHCDCEKKQTAEGAGQHADKPATETPKQKPNLMPGA